MAEESSVDQGKDEPTNTCKDGIISVHVWVNYRKSGIIPRNIASSSRNMNQKCYPNKSENISSVIFMCELTSTLMPTTLQLIHRTREKCNDVVRYLASLR